MSRRQGQATHRSIPTQAPAQVVASNWDEYISQFRLLTLEVEALGPATVAIDAHGNCIYESLRTAAQRRPPEILENQLGYDSPSTTPRTDIRSKDCVPPADDTHPPGIAPPPRLLLDRAIKEQVFDRNLADAILYFGSYRAVMEKGVADTLCRMVVRTDDKFRCDWSGTPGIDEQGVR